MEDVAREAGVSRSLVSLVFQGSPKVADATRARVVAVAEDLGYRPNALARSLASSRTSTIGILVDDLRNPFFAKALTALEDAAAAAGSRALLADGRRDARREEEAVRTFADHRVDGVVAVSPRLADGTLAELARLVPIVVLERDVAGIDVVMHDERLGAHLVIDHLVELGHTHITHIDGGRGAGAAPRREGYREAMAAHGLMAGVDVIAGEYTEDGGRTAALAMLQRGELPTAVFCANDAIAAGVASVLDEHGIEVPDAISLVGYDDTTLAELRLLSLTSVRQPLDLLAEAAIAALDARIREPGAPRARTIVPPSLVVRRSSAPPRD